MEDTTINAEVGAEAPVEEIETGEAVETAEDTGEAIESEQDEELSEKEIELEKNRLAEFNRKQAKLKALRETKAKNAELAQQIAKERAEVKGDTHTNADDDEDDEYIDPDIKHLKSEYARLNALIEEDRKNRTERENAEYQKQLEEANEAVVTDLFDIVRGATDKAIKLDDGPHKEFIHEQTELRVRAFVDIAERNNVDLTDEVVDKFTKDTVTAWRRLFGSAAEKQLKDAAAVRDKTKVKPGSGSIGTKAPPDERTLSRDEQIKLTEERVKRAEEAARQRF